MRPPTFHRDRVRARPWRAAVCLLAYLLAATPLLPIVTAWTAQRDGEHRVAWLADKNGMRVVLGHDAEDRRTATSHAHGVVSRVLTLLAEPSGPAHADHVLHFQSGSPTPTGAGGPRAEAAPMATTSLPSWRPATGVLPRRVRGVEALLLDLPPPALSVAVVRSTLFLI